MTSPLAAHLVPDRLWSIVEPLLPPDRHHHDRNALVGVVYCVITGQGFACLPDWARVVSVRVVRSRFRAWTRVGVWAGLLTEGRR